MKRRDFLKASVGFSGTMIPGYVLAGLNPCPPSRLSAQGGTSSTATCAPVSDSALPSLQLISEAAAGTYGWTVGHPFRRGHVMTGVGADGDSIQCDVRNRWPDGSIKFAVLSGVSSINKFGQIKLVPGTSASGTAIPESRILDILGTKDVTLSLGSFGQVALRALVGSTVTKDARSPGRVRTAASGPIMSEFHYMGIPSGGDPHLRAWFYVRVYANDSMEIETVVENGWLQEPSPGQRIYAASLRLMDTVVNINDSAPIQHYHHTRWSRSDWIGTDPQITPRHDGAYLRSTRLVPNFGYPLPTETAFKQGTRVQSNVDARYHDAMRPRPFELGNLRSVMGVAGEKVSDQIGLLPFWEGLAITSGDSRAVNASIMNARNLGRYAVFIRDETTLAPPLRTTPGYERLSTKSGLPWPDEPAPDYARSHHPSWGYFPYLITGRWQFWEACAGLAAYNHFQTSPADPWPLSGTNGRAGNAGIVNQVGGNARILAWSLRTLAQATCITPDDHPLQREFREQWATNMDHYWGLQSGKYVSVPIGRRMENNLGIVLMGANTRGHEPLDGLLVGAPWMHHYVACAIGFSWDLEINRDSGSRTNHERLRNHAYKAIIGMCGIGRTDSNQPLGYSWRRLPNNYLAFGTVDEGGLGVNGSPPPAQFWNSWSEVYEKMLEVGSAKHQPDTASNLPFVDVASVPPPFGLTDAFGTLDTVITPHLKYAMAGLAMASDHGVDGAATALSRIRASSSWQKSHMDARDYPAAGVLPRN